MDDIKRTIKFTLTPELREKYEKIITSEETTFKEKRDFELLIVQIISSHDYKRVKPIIEMALSSVSPLKFTNPILVYHTVAIITLLTRIAIIDGVSEKDAYSLSDTYLSLNFHSLKVDPVSLVYEITKNFMKLIENASHFDYDSLLISQVTNYIHNNITQKFSLKTLAIVFGVTPEHLSSHFKEITGIPLKDFINKEKINHSKFLLVSTEMPLLEIALELGYTDQSYFSKVFKNYTKKSPLQYRKEGRIKFKQSKFSDVQL